MGSPQGDTLSNEYVAGFFDGEGCITTQKRFIKGKYEKYPRINIRACIANTDIGILERIKSKFGGKIKCSKKGRNIPCYDLRIIGKQDLLGFLLAIEEHSVVKRDQIALAIKFCETIREQSLGCKPLSKEKHSLRDYIHAKLKEAKTRHH